MNERQQRASDTSARGGREQRPGEKDQRDGGVAGGFRRRAARKCLVLAAAGVTAAAAVTGGLAALPAAASQATAIRTVAATTPIVPAVKTSASSAKGRMCRPLLLVVKSDYDRLPESLRKDIESAAHQSSASAKHTALENVLKKAQSGGYGSAVESVAKSVKTLRGLKAEWDHLPSSLRDDLKKAKEASGTTRSSDLKAALSKAESGGYGDRVKDAVDKVKTRLDTCAARAEGAGSSSTTAPKAPSMSSPTPSTAPTGTPSSTPTAGA